MRACPIAFLIAWLLASGGFAHAENRVFFQDEHLIVAGDTGLEPEAAYLVQDYPAALGNIGRMLGWELLSRPRVFLTGNREDFEKISGSPFVSALAIPSEHMILMYISPATSRPYVLDETFTHELCHLLLHDHIPESNLPRWLDEGICQWVSGTIGEGLGGEGMAFGRIDMARRLIPLSRLAVNFPKDRESLFLAYEEGRSFVTFVADRYGSGGLRGILNHLEQGNGATRNPGETDPVEAAVTETLGKSFREVQEEWIEDMRHRNEWLVWAAQHLYEILFFAAAVLSAGAFIRLKGRMKRARFDDEEDEKT